MRSTRRPKFTPFDPKDLLEIAKKKGVIIVLDNNGTSSEAEIESCYSYDTKKRILKIVSHLLRKIDYDVWKQIILMVFDAGDLLWHDADAHLISEYRAYLEGKSDLLTLEFFKDIIPSDDYNALRMALFMRASHRERIPILKQQIVDRFGERGTNIANLCSAGYFESEFKPLFNVLGKDEFDEYYELAVGQKARALFVHHNMNIGDLNAEFERMVKLSERYHMFDFRIHGLGDSNVALIRNFIKEQQKKSTELEKAGDLTKYFIKKTNESEVPKMIEYTVEFVF